ncbi:hypothetical protein PMAYCL1PPCAC_27818, partial [Pristionchus mayeri]
MKEEPFEVKDELIDDFPDTNQINTNDKSSNVNVDHVEIKDEPIDDLAGTKQANTTVASSKP